MLEAVTRREVMFSHWLGKVIFRTLEQNLMGILHCCFRVKLKIPAGGSFQHLKMSREEAEAPTAPYHSSL